MEVVLPYEFQNVTSRIQKFREHLFCERHPAVHYKQRLLRIILNKHAVERKHGKNLCAEIFKPLCQTNLLLRITILCMQIMSISVDSALCAP